MAHCSRVFEKIEFAADDAPATGLGRAAAEREEQTAGFVNQEEYPRPPWDYPRRAWGCSFRFELVARRVQRGLAECGKEALGERVTAEEERPVESVTRKHVPEEGNGGDVAGEQTFASVRVS